MTYLIDSFVVLNIKRHEIASLLNDILDDDDTIDVPHFDLTNDVRLTDQFCTEIADTLHDLHDEQLAEEDFVDERRALFTTIIKNHFVK